METALRVRTIRRGKFFDCVFGFGWIFVSEETVLHVRTLRSWDEVRFH